MNVYNLMIMLKVFLCYTILVFGFSAFFLQPVLKGKRCSISFLACFLAGNFYIMNMAFVLLFFFHCSNRMITILAFVLTAFLIRMLLDYKRAIWNMKEDFYKLLSLIFGTYGWRLFLKEIKKKIFYRLKLGVSFIFVKHQTELFGILLCLVIQAIYTGYRLVVYSGYGGYDEIVHTNWIQAMMNGEIYSSGVYPFGFHEMAYSIAKIFGFPASQLVRYFGFIIMIYLTLMLYFLIADTLEHKIAAFLAVFIYAGVNIYIQEAWDRCGFGYPQEFGAVFLYPMMIFLFFYFKEKKKFYLLFFGMSFSLTLYVHYYITIIALIFCFSAGIFYLIYMIRKRLLLPILLCGLIAGGVGTVTMVLGVAAGHPLQNSLYWALGVISGEEWKEGEGQTGTEIEHNIISDNENITGNETVEKKDAENENTRVSFLWKLYDKIYQARLQNCMTRNSFRMFCIFTIVSFFIGIFYLFSRQDRIKGIFIITFLSYLFFLDILMISQELGLPTLIETYRVRVFLCYALPYTLAVPISFTVTLLEKSYAARERTVLQRISMIPIVIFAIVTLTRYHLYRYPLRTTVIQSDAVVDVLYQIIEDYDDFTWTLVSDVQEYTMCVGNGQHYEWITLLEKLSSGVTDIRIPTKYIFFAIEKKPISYGTVIESGEEVPILGKVSKYYAEQEITFDGDLPYINERLEVMSKAYYWARAYAEKFPEEMQIYYEDEDVIYYRLTQETYYLNNLKLDYGYN